jgi:brefeldin A-inhibited guanine nucleotide-exchange protein
MPLRHAIYKKGWVAQLPNLVKQETTSYQAYLMVLFNMVQTQKDDECTYKLVSECTDVLERCVTYCQDLQKHQRDLVSWTPTLVLIYKLALDVPHKYLPRFYRYAIRLLSADQQQLKQAHVEFLERIGSVVFKGGDYEQVSS